MAADTTENHGTKRDLENAHTPTPWALLGRGDIIGVCKGFPQKPVAKVVGQETSAERAANISLILRAVNSHEALVSALEAMLRGYDRNICEHEETYRGGVIWTICRGCGRKWADDEGGFKPHCDPIRVVNARSALAAARGEA